MAARAHCERPGTQVVGSAADVVVRHIESTCRLAIDGRRAARALADWARHSALSEPDFQLLWCLRTAPSDGLDQTTLARRLGFSTAQVSSLVERARTRCWIQQHESAVDRRRNLWRLSHRGEELLQSMIRLASTLRFDDSCEGVAAPPEAAA